MKFEIGGKYSGLYCLVCGHPAPDLHHVKTRGAGGEKTLPLCRAHHTECHAIGRWTFAKKYKLTDRFREIIGERKYSEWLKTQEVKNEITL